MTDEAIDHVDDAPPPSAPVPAPELVDEGDAPELNPETFDQAIRSADAPPAAQWGELPAPLPDALEVPELAPPEHRFAEEVQQNLAQLASVAKAEGMPLSETQGLVSLYYELESTLGDLKVDQRDPGHQDKTHAMLRRNWGTAYKDNLADARKAFKSLSPATQNWLNETGAGDDVSVLTILAAMGGGLLKLTPAQAKAEADAMRNGSANLRNQSSPSYQAVLTKYRILRHLEGRGEGDQSERASEKRGKDTMRDMIDAKAGKKPDAARTKLEDEAKQLRLSPAWHDKRDPAHKAVAARLSAIFAQLYPGD
jgi:hypothetical protein